MRWANGEPQFEALMVCSAGCGKRFRFSDVKQHAVVIKTVRDPETGEQLAARCQVTCPACGASLALPGLYFA